MMPIHFKKWLYDTTGVAAIEAALIFPTLVMMLVSMVDIGHGLLSNQRVITAAQTTADLIARGSNPTMEDRANAILAGQLVMNPYPLDTYDYSVVSYEFDDSGDADVVWQEASGSGLSDGSTNGLSDLGGPGEGVVVVEVRYTYQPFFTGFVVGPIEMSEIAYLRGRKSAVVGLPEE
jgi:Flp pilus assembly protein TadG